jgi:hypothetical protein
MPAKCSSGAEVGAKFSLWKNCERCVNYRTVLCTFFTCPGRFIKRQSRAVKETALGEPANLVGPREAKGAVEALARYKPRSLKTNEYEVAFHSFFTSVEIALRRGFL